MQLSQEQQAFYESARERCRQDVSEMNHTIRAEWKHLNDEIKRVGYFPANPAALKQAKQNWLDAMK